MEITAKDLRTQTKRVLESVERGEEVIITYRGEPRAKVVALDPTPQRGQGQELFGIWEDNEDVQDVEAYIDGLRKARD
ncbi:MAG: type II toxin-antitoxin system prevent-host-death family antitoxin [Deferrisomatales bacterium]|nr:type II toxin-antitoxin system prevent-host-death family antitoxin [Deferrisomatales bacterium]